MEERITRRATALARAEALALALRLEGERGNQEAAGTVDIVAVDDKTIMQRFVIVGG